MVASALHTAAISAVLLSFSVFAPAVCADTAGGYTYTIAADGSAVITGYEGTDTVLVLPDTLGGAQVTEIGESAFAQNQSITSITIPEGIKEIGDFAFNDCSGLKKVSLPDSLVAVGEGAFFSCARLTATARCPADPWRQRLLLLQGTGNCHTAGQRDADGHPRIL